MGRIKKIISIILATVMFMFTFSALTFAENEESTTSETVVEQGGGTDDESETETEQEKHIVKVIEVTDTDDGYNYVIDDGWPIHGSGTDNDIGPFDALIYYIMLPDNYETNDETVWYFNGAEIPTFVTSVVPYSVIDGGQGNYAYEIFLIWSYRWFGSALIWHFFNLIDYGVWF